MGYLFIAFITLTAGAFFGAGLGLTGVANVITILGFGLWTLTAVWAGAWALIQSIRYDVVQTTPSKEPGAHNVELCLRLGRFTYSHKVPPMSDEEKAELA